MKIVGIVSSLVVSLLLVANLSAAEGDKGAAKPERRPMMSLMAGIDMLKNLGVNLTDEQKAKLEEFKKEYEPKVKEAWKKREGILSDEQKKAVQEAMKTLRTPGKREDFRKVMDDAMKLTPKQKGEMDEANKVMETLQKEIRTKVEALLTAEQKEQMKKAIEGRRTRKPESK